MGRSAQSWANVMARTKAEWERSVSINFSVKYLITEASIFTLIDLPGKREYIKNSYRGLSQADVVILVIPAPEQEFQASFSLDGIKEHAVLAFTQGARQMICVVNKMDNIDAPTNYLFKNKHYEDVKDFSEKRFNDIKDKMHIFLKKVGYKPENIPFIPVSAIWGDNLIEKSIKAKWYQGPTLLEAMENLKEP